ncbi:putative molybdenum carrier protein [soil metagenome]
MIATTSFRRPPLRAARTVRIVSGGQTGVDRAALDVAAELGLRRGGWCPAGRWAEDGPIDPRYPLRETGSPDPAERTLRNVRDTDATLVLSAGPPRGGTALAVAEARRRGKPLLRVDPREAAAVADARVWLARHQVRSLNVAGPRASEAPGAYAAAAAFLRRLLGTASVEATRSPNVAYSRW